MNRKPLRDVDPAEIEAYDRDGAILLQGMLDADWIESLRAGIERDIANPGPGYHGYLSDNSQGRFHGNYDLWRHDRAFADYCLTSPLPALAASLMQSERVQLLYDQLFVKEPGTPSPTPWHNDQPYWPVKGWRVISFWLALDPVTKESGAVEFVRGSHRWDRWFQPKTFAKGGFEYEQNPDYEPMIDVEATRDQHDIVSWNMEPGDLIAFHALTVHGSGGNRRSDLRRRGYTVRYVGDGVVYEPRPGVNPVLKRDGHPSDVPLRQADYPEVWPVAA